MSSTISPSSLATLVSLLSSFREVNWRNFPASDREHLAAIEAHLETLPASVFERPEIAWAHLGLETVRHLAPNPKLEIAAHSRHARHLLSEWSKPQPPEIEANSWIDLLRYQTARELEHHGQMQEAREMLQPLLEKTPPTVRTLPEALIHTLGGLLALRFNEYEEARRHLEAAVAFLTLEAYPAECSVALCYCGSLEFYEGKLTAARRSYEQALEAAEKAGDPDDIAYVQYFLAMILSRTQDLAQGLAHITQALPQIRQGNSFQMQSASLNLQGYLFHQMGAYDEAIACQREALEIVPREGNPMARSACYLRIAEAQRATGQYAEAQRHTEKALELSQQGGNRKEEASLHTLLGKLALDREDPIAAEKHASHACDLYRETGALDYLPDALLVLAKAYRRQDRFAAAVETHRRFFEMEEPDQVQQIEHRLALAEGILEHCDDLPEAVFQLREANGSPLLSSSTEPLEGALFMVEQTLEAARKHHYRWGEEEAHKLLCRLHRTQGNFAAALEALEAANAVHAITHAEKSDLRVKSLSVRFEAEEARRREEIARLRNVELAAANEALASLNEEKTHFLSIAAHDLKNPLGAIQQLASFGRDAVKRGETSYLGEYLSDIEEAAGSMLRLVSNLLDLNRLEEGRLLGEIAEVDLAAIATAVIERLRPSAEAKGQKLKTDFEAAPATVLADPDLLAQVLQNLLSNAIKYAPWESPITLRLQASGETIRCSVSDSGPGISEADQTKLFTRFTRLSARPTGDEHSNGLGLAIAKELTTLMHGEIGCESRLGEGATFFIGLPKAPAG